MRARVVWRVVLLRVPVSQLIGNIQKKSGARTPVHTTRPRHFFNLCKDPFWDYYLGFEKERERPFFEHLSSALLLSFVFIIRFPPKKKQNKKKRKGGVCTSVCFVPRTHLVILLLVYIRGKEECRNRARGVYTSRWS